LKRVVKISNNGGITNISFVTVKDGRSAGSGGGMFVENSNVLLIVVAFISNRASSRGGAIYVFDTGSSTVTLKGNFLDENTSPRGDNYGPDVYNWEETVIIYTCPAGYTETQGSALNNVNSDGGTMTDPAYSYSCLKECPAGEFSVYGRATCVNACPVGSYISGDQACTSCPENWSTSSTGSTSVAECNICDVSYFLDGSSCTSCGAGETTVSTGSTSVDQCMCMTSGIATCFASASNGDDILMSPGTLSSTDGIYFTSQLTLQSKYATITCSADGGACILQGATGKGVVLIKNNGGTTTLSFLVIKNGDYNSGGGLFVWNSNVVLILVSLIDNAAVNGGAMYVHNIGSSLVTLQGCSFAGNTASSSYGPDVYNRGETVAIDTCPAEYTATQGSALSNINYGGTMTTPAYSFTCQNACHPGEFGNFPTCTECVAGE